MPKSAILNEQRLADAVRACAVEAVDEFITEARERITQRAFELFEANGRCSEHELDDWLTAERELFWRPMAQIVQRDGVVDIEIAMPGVRPEDVDVQVTEHQLLVRSAECRGGTCGEADKVHVDELPRGEAFRVFDFAETLKPASARASLRDGLLKIELAVAAPAEATKVQVAA